MNMNIRSIISVCMALGTTVCVFSGTNPSMNDRKKMVRDLLKSIETGDTKPVGHINSRKYGASGFAVGLPLR